MTIHTSRSRGAMRSQAGASRVGALGVAAFAVLFGSLLSSCGGGGGSGAGRGLSLVSFEQDGVDNVALNQTLVWHFSEAVDPSSITTASLQLRRGDQFGQSVDGVFHVQGSTVTFEPRLPSRCDLQDAGFRASTQYRVQLVGYPEEFAIKNSAGQPLSTTISREFRTRDESGPQRFLDQIPAFTPSVTLISPANGSAAVTVNASNAIVVTISENLEPCTVNDNTVQLFMNETGDPVLANAVTAPNGNASGFYHGGGVGDNSAALTSWGADVYSVVNPAQRLLIDITLQQSSSSTQIIVRPKGGVFPENALLVFRLTSGIEDFGGSPLAPLAMSFTTQNLAPQAGLYAMLVQGETPFESSQSTADINTARSPGVIQGYLLFSGDGDNGDTSEIHLPSAPNEGAGCLTPRQTNDGTKDDFMPNADFTFDTGATLNTCPNSVDGSTAVVWEFNTFRIPGGVTVRVKGVNPAVFLVQGEVLIESGGRLMARGDNVGGTPQGRGANGWAWVNQPGNVTSAGGVGVAGGGNGGKTGLWMQSPGGESGFAGFGSDDFGDQGGLGAGIGGVSHGATYPGSAGSAQGGGGGGHGSAGDASTNVLGTLHVLRSQTPMGLGGDPYPASSAMLTPSAGSGGGAGGNNEWEPSNSYFYGSGGGGGGAGGGFVDITSSGNITVFGTIDAVGGRGGDSQQENYYSGSGGGGGGSGGGIRLLTSARIILGATTVISTAGGSGGLSTTGTSAPNGPLNHGASGGNGRIVLEDADSTIEGMSGATLAPGEGTDGFYRDVFDPTRFQGGGTMPYAQTEIFAVGPLNPNFSNPVAADFKARIPVIASNGAGATSIFIDARGFNIKPDGTPDLAGATPWHTVGYFRDSGVEAEPLWTGNANPGDVMLPVGNAGGTINNLDGREFIQIRVTFYLPATMGPSDPGPVLDDWMIRYVTDQ